MHCLYTSLRQAQDKLKLSMTVHFIAQYSYSIAVTSSGYQTQKISGTFAA